MFLYLLNKNEGKAFIELAAQAMKVDGEEKECEKAEIEAYLTELDMAGYRIMGMEYEDAISTFKYSSIPVKRAVILELCGILYADKVIDSKEEKWIYSLADALNINKNEVERLVCWSKDFSDFIEVGLMYINAK